MSPSEAAPQAPGLAPAPEPEQEAGSEPEAAAPSVANKVTNTPVSEEEIMTFLFPPDQQHPSSASRLFSQQGHAAL